MSFFFLAQKPEWVDVAPAILWTTHPTLCLPIRCDPILIPLNPEDMDKHLLEVFSGGRPVLSMY